MKSVTIQSTMRTVVGVSAALLSLATVASAQSILVDFSNIGSPDAGLNWNVAAGDSFNVTNMVDTAGNDTGINLTFSEVENDAGNTWGVTGAPSPFDVSAAYQDGLYGSANFTTIFQLQNLSPTATYTITLFGSRDANDASGRFTDYTITGSGGSSTLSLQTSGTDLGGSGIHHNISDVVVFSDISANGSNAIQISFVNASGFSYLNAMEIAVIPEVSSSAMILGACSLMLLVVRRRVRG